MEPLTRYTVRPGLTVKDLIAELQKLDPDLPLMMRSSSYGESGYFVYKLEVNSRDSLIRDKRTVCQTDGIIYECHQTKPFAKLAKMQVAFVEFRSDRRFLK